jgi:integrase
MHKQAGFSIGDQVAVSDRDVIPYGRPGPIKIINAKKYLQEFAKFRGTRGASADGKICPPLTGGSETGTEKLARCRPASSQKGSQMASISTDGKTGLKRLVFTGLDGKRRTVYLGKVSDRFAQQMAGAVEDLLGSALVGQAPGPQTVAFVANLPSKMEAKLVAPEVIFPRGQSEPVTLGGFLTDYITRRTDLKGATLVFYGHTLRNLRTIFSENCELSDITPGDADDFRRKLQKLKLSPVTVARRCSAARTIFHDAVRHKLIESNPFQDITGGPKSNPERQCFIDQDTIARVIDCCPNAEWRLLVALSRFGGLRIPSEALSLRWDDIDFAASRMMIHSPKTEHHAGKAMRLVPIFPELRPYLEDMHELALPGTEYVLDGQRRAGAIAKDWQGVNLRTRFLKIIKRAGVTPWPRLWHNLRSSRQTELTETFPSHVVSAWLGNSERIAEKHYLQVLDSHFAKAVEPGPEKTTRNPTRATPESERSKAHQATRNGKTPLFSRGFHSKDGR